MLYPIDVVYRVVQLHTYKHSSRVHLILVLCMGRADWYGVWPAARLRLLLRPGPEGGGAAGHALAQGRDREDCRQTRHCQVLNHAHT